MRLKVKNLNWLAGRPVVILNEKTAKRINIFANDRIEITKPKKVFAIVDIFSKIIGKKEIGLSHELSRFLNLKNKEIVEVNPSEMSKATFLIRKKMQGKKLDSKELELLISEIVQNSLSEAEIAYFTAAEKLKGMSIKETVNLTKAMMKTGAKLKFKGKYIADKHCIGGIAGNRTTPILVAICAAAGLTIPKTSSRAITSAAGTVDVVETISNVDLSSKEIKRVVSKAGACLAWGGSIGLAPSDDKIIRVERLLNLDIESQLLASIMSKKISAGSNYLLVDIPFGRESKVPNIKKAKKLGGKFKKMAKRFNLKIKVVYTKGNQPIGNGLGPVLEMIDIIKVLKNSEDAPTDLKEKSIYLSSELIKLCGLKNSKRIAEETLSSGKAYEKFKEIICLQNNSKDIEKRIRGLKPGKIKKIIKSKKNGRIVKISNKKINSICRILGTPETISSGIYLHKHLGKIKKGEPLMTLYTRSKTKLRDALKFIKEFEPIKIK